MVALETIRAGGFSERRGFFDCLYPYLYLMDNKLSLNLL